MIMGQIITSNRVQRGGSWNNNNNNCQSWNRNNNNPNNNNNNIGFRVSNTSIDRNKIRDYFMSFILKSRFDPALMGEYDRANISGRLTEGCIGSNTFLKVRDMARHVSTDKFDGKKRVISK